jgi:hypothetical protein
MIGFSEVGARASREKSVANVANGTLDPAHLHGSAPRLPKYPLSRQAAKKRAIESLSDNVDPGLYVENLTLGPAAVDDQRRALRFSGSQHAA